MEATPGLASPQEACSEIVKHHYRRVNSPLCKLAVMTKKTPQVCRVFSNQ